MNHGSLFSGIGGFDLAAELMGWENKFHCEWNEFGQKVLKHYWPKAISYNDIKKTDFTIHRGEIDIITGGFPCQPYSLAGKRKGKEDDRHLWPEMLRAIREIQPSWVVGENVFGLINWGGGLVFHEVQADLEAEGYEVWPYVLPACSVNAPHRRDRIWFVAYSRHNSKRSARNSSADERAKSSIIHKEGQGGDRETVFNSRSCDLSGDATNTNSDGQFGSNSEYEINASERRKHAQRDTQQMGGDVAHSQSEGSSGELQQRQKQGQSGRCNSEKLSSYTESNRPQGQRGFGEVIATEGVIATVCTNEGTSAPHAEHSNSNRFSNGCQQFITNKSGQHIGGHTESGRGFTSDSERIRPSGQEYRLEKSGQHTEENSGFWWSNFPTQSPICTGDDGIPRNLDGITFPKWRNESIKAAGNAIVPQVALQIFKAIQEYENLYNKS